VDRLTVAVNCVQEQLTDILRMAEVWKEALTGELNVRCMIGAGKFCAEIGELPRAYEEAEEALLHRSIAGDCEVIYIEDVRLTAAPFQLYSKDRETAMLSYMKHGDTANAVSMYVSIVEEIVSQEGRIPFHQAKQAFMQLLVGLMETATELHIDLHVRLGEKLNPYDALLQKNDLSDIRIWLQRIIESMATYVSSAFQEKNNRHVAAMIRMIENECGNLVSLAGIADSLQLNPSYLSRIFKESTGQSFQEYLTATRIEKGKKLLLETDLKIKDICDRLGYQQVNYFIKLFREATGITPGEYRKMHLPL
jgi:YesN/AraC family two-component response regulator